MKKNYYDVAIIGGGASGLAAAIELKSLSPELSVVIIEKNDSLGRKIRATGNGRCNITNKNANGYIEIMKWFMRIGLMTRSCESDLVYPYSESAADVVDLLTEGDGPGGYFFTKGDGPESGCSKNSSVDTWCNSSVTGITFDDTFEITVIRESNRGDRKAVSGKLQETVRADKVILATGGKAGPEFGTTGDGYKLAAAFDHSIVTPIPVLTGIECEDWDKTLAGVRAKGVVSLYRDETGQFDESSKIFEESGEIQFTKTGLSGIAIFNMTRFMRYNRAEGETLGQFQVKLNLFPEGDIQEFLRMTGRGSDSEFSAESRTNNPLATVLKKELAEYVLKQGIESIHALTFTPSAVKGWKDAQVTSGGVDLGEIDPDTCESRLQPGLYITGELLDYDGPCGGYNLSNAWLTGLKAARSIANPDLLI